MAKKAFEIQGSDLSLGGVSLQAGTTGVVIPGVTQAANYFVEEVEDQDGNNPDTFGSDENDVTVIDNAEYLYRSGAETASASYSAAGYSVDELDDGEIEEIAVEVDGIFLDSDRQLALRDKMWATTVADPYTSFNANDWTQIPFKPKLRAGEVENVGGTGGGSLTVGNGTSASFSNVTEILINGDITEIEPGLVGITIAGGEGLGTITVPAETGTDYKGLQVAYGGFHSNSENATRNVTKVVIHKPATAITTIASDSNSDFFQVAGVGSSDVLAMFVVVGDVNGEKPISDIQSFAEAVIDLVILDSSIPGQYNTVDEMKAAFYDNYPSLALAANGVATGFQFYDNYVAALNGGVTTVRQGSGAIFEIQDLGDGTYNGSGMISGGINYLAGHKIKILGTDLGGATPDNDCIITVNTVDSEGILSWSVSGTAAGSTLTLYSPVTGTNYNVGSGFAVNAVYANNSNIDLNTYGTNYVAGDVITLLGANLTNGTTPENNFTITVAQVDGNGQAYDYTSTGTAPVVWRTNSISDGGNDEYDTGNYIDSSYDEQIAYNGGETVVNSASAFGTGSSYSVVYETSIFGLFVTGNSSTRIGTSGSGPDSGSTIISGHIYGPNTAEQTFDNAVTHLNLVGDRYAGPLITFIKPDNGDEVDEVSDGLHIARSNNGGWLYNPQEDEGHGDDSPYNSLWNNDGWDDFTDVESRTYVSLASIWQGNFNQITGARMIMKDTSTNKYWAVYITGWGYDGGFSYTRQELDLDSLEVGIRFPDGTRQTTAYVSDDRVKLRSPGSRRIEEVYGYKQVSVTGTTTSNTVTTTAFSSNSNDTQYVSLSASGAARDALIALANGSVYYRVQVSLNQTDWATGSVNGWGNDDVGIYFDDGARLAVAQGDIVYYRTYTGGESVVWWDKDDLPGGSGNFRGAVIDYHAYTGDATIIGTIHIVDDDGEENITHTEVSSGSSDSENDDLWYVTSEGEIRYRRLDGESSTLKIQWTAKVFYGSELYD
jgi:hypothetical protein